MHDDPERYRSAVGWEHPDPYKKLREKARRATELAERSSEPILCSVGDAPAFRRTELFASLWRTGEVALLFGEPGVGKSIFAVHLAEAIGSADIRMSEANHPDPPRPKRVLYIDLQRTASQFHHRSSTNAFQRRHFDWGSVHADETDSIRAKRLHASIYDAIDDGAEVIILDDITLGGINIGRPNGPLRTLRTLKMFAAERGTSFLVIAGAAARKRPRPASLSDVAFRHIAEQADSVFCLAASTYGPAFRYIRHLRSTSGPIVHDASAVLTYQLVTNALHNAVIDPVDNAATSPPDSSDFIPHSAFRTPHSERLRFLGDCAESEHLRDYAAEALHAQRENERQLKRSSNRSSKNFLIDGLLDGSYTKYLKGE